MDAFVVLRSNNVDMEQFIEDFISLLSKRDTSKDRLNLDTIIKRQTQLGYNHQKTDSTWIQSSKDRLNLDTIIKRQTQLRYNHLKTDSTWIQSSKDRLDLDTIIKR